MTMRQSRRPVELPSDELNLMERVVTIRRVAKVVKGGRHLSFNAMVVVGDGEGNVGIGMGDGAAVPDAVRKGNAIAKKSMIPVPLKGTTIPHRVNVKFQATLLLLKPAPAGTGIIAGGAARAVLELAGVRDVVAKCLGSRNPINVVKATMKGLGSLRNPIEELAKRKRLPMLRPEVGTATAERPSEGEPGEGDGQAANNLG